MASHLPKSKMEDELNEITRQMGQCLGDEASRGITLPSDIEDVSPCFVENYKCRNPEETALLKRLRLLNCHFTWTLSTIDNSPATPIKARIQTLMEKEESDPSDDHEIYKYYHIIQLSYYLALCGDYQKSLDLLNNAAAIVKAESLVGIQEGLKYIIDCNRAFIWMLRKDYDQSEEILKLLPSFKTLGKHNQAAISGVYGVTLMELGIKGSEKAVLIFRDCTAQDPRSYHWHACLGQSLLRIRHAKDHRGMPTDEECASLRRAVDLGPPNELRPMIFLAQCLREKSNCCHSMNAPRSTTNEINREVRCLYDRALEANPNCNAKHLVRFADGYMKLPHPYKNTDAAERCIKKALVLAEDNSMVNHKAASFYEIVKEDYKQALKYLTKANLDPKRKPPFPVDKKIVELRALLEPSYNPIQRLTEMLEIYKIEVENYTMSIYMLRGLFYYLRNDDVNAAVKDWVKAYDVDEVAFEKEFFFCLRSQCFTKDQRMVQKIERFPNHLYKLMQSETNQRKVKMFKEVSSKTSDIISGMKRKSSRGAFSVFR